jgi:hypothetical protein
MCADHRGHGMVFEPVPAGAVVTAARQHDHVRAVDGPVHGLRFTPSRKSRTKPASSATPAATATPAANVPLSSVPVLNSRPSASAQIYLDFLGAAAMHWGSYNVPTTPAYDVDGDPTTFSPTELANINEIFQRVAEKYSPFNINVTTVDPGTYNNKGAQRVVIGGAGAWLGSTAGGVSYVGSFTNGNPNTSWVFSKNLLNGDPKDTAEAASHEAGHAFGLEHQSLYSGTSKTAEYNSGTALTAPVMGNSYSAARGLWWNGPNSLSSTTIQDDLAVISNASNGFGYRADDHGDTVSTADSFTVSGSTLTASGVIEKTTDVDDFSFTTGAGTDTFTLAVAPYGAMLDGTLRLLNSSGTVIATADTASLGETLSVSLSAGTYVLQVASHGGYGDVGQYSVTGTVVEPLASPAPPSGLSAVAVSATQVNLAWTDNDFTATGIKVMRSNDGGVTFSQIGPNIVFNATSYADTTASAGTVYTYELLTYGPAGNSQPSNVATVTTDGNGAGLTGTYFSDDSLGNAVLTRIDPTINFNWADASPDASIDADHFSARWTGQVQAKFSEDYTFIVNADDGVRLWVNGNLVIDQWSALPDLYGDINHDGRVDFFDLSQILATKYNTGQAATYEEGDINGDGVVDFFDITELFSANWQTSQQPRTSTATVTLQAGQKYDITLEYFQQTGLASAQLQWSSPSTPLQIIPQSQLYAQ